MVEVNRFRMEHPLLNCHGMLNEKVVEKIRPLLEARTTVPAPPRQHPKEEDPGGT
jgi:hypothetical protein